MKRIKCRGKMKREREKEINDKGKLRREQKHREAIQIEGKDIERE